MAFAKKIVNRSDDPVAGDDFILQEAPSGSSEYAQGVVTIDDSGNPSGITANPLKTSIVGTVTVAEAAETFESYSSPVTGEDSKADVAQAAGKGTSPCEIRQIRCILDPSVAATRYLLFFDSLTVPADGTTLPIWRMVIPVGGEASETFVKGELAFATGLSIALSSTVNQKLVTSASEGFFQVVVV